MPILCLTNQLLTYLMAFIWIPTDGHRLSDYAIGPEAKLNLVIRQTGEKTGALGVGSSSSTRERVWQILSTILARHFSPADSSKVLEHLIKVFQCSAQQHPSAHQIEAKFLGKMRGREHTGKLTRSLQGQYKQATNQMLMQKLTLKVSLMSPICFAHQHSIYNCSYNWSFKSFCSLKPLNGLLSARQNQDVPLCSFIDFNYTYLLKWK